MKVLLNQGDNKFITNINAYDTSHDQTTIISLEVDQSVGYTYRITNYQTTDGVYMKGIIFYNRVTHLSLASVMLEAHPYLNVEYSNLGGEIRLIYRPHVSQIFPREIIKLEFVS